MQRLSNPSKKKGWLKISQQLKALFQANANSMQREEIDYYHQYVFPKEIDRMKQINNKSTRFRGPSRKEL